MKRFVGLACLVVAGLGFLSAGASGGQFYAGKTLTIIVGFGAGGGYDQSARLLARHIGNHIPGEPSVIVDNMPGAGSRKATSYLYNVAPKDGLMIGIVSQNLPLDQVLRSNKKYDLSRFNWIGNLDTANNVVLTWHTSHVKTFHDALKETAAIGGTVATGTSVIYPLAMNRVLGTKFRIVSGYPDASATMLAMERGEIDGQGSNSLATIRRSHPDWISGKKVNFIVQIGRKKDPELSDVPLLTDLARNENDRKVLKFVSSGVAMGRPFLAPPNVPQKRIEILRDAFNAAVKDPALLADARRLKMEVNPSTWEDLAEITSEVSHASPQVIARTKAVLTLKK